MSWNSGSPQLLSSPCRRLRWKAMPMVPHTRTPVSMPANSRAGMNTASSRAASGTICRKKRLGTLPRLSSMSTRTSRRHRSRVREQCWAGELLPHAANLSSTNTKEIWYGNPKPNNHSNRNPSLPRRHARRSVRRPAPAYRRGALSRQGARRRCVAGRAADDAPRARALLEHRLRLAQVRDEAERPPAVHDEDRRPRHPLHPREIASRECVAADHHARLARLGDRDARGHRPAHGPDRARRTRRGRIRPGAAVPARLRLLRRADGGRLGPRPHCASVGGADDPSGLHPLRRPGRRPGRQRHRRDGTPGSERPCGRPPQFARRFPACGAGRDLRRQYPRPGGTAQAACGSRCGRRGQQRTGGIQSDSRRVQEGLLRGDGLAPWMLDHDPDSYQKISHVFVDGEPVGGLTRDRILDNMTLYWLTSTATSAARLYWEETQSIGAALASGQKPPKLSLPVGFTVFPSEIIQAPRSWVEKVYPNLIYFHQADRGGHFAAWEEPELFAAELRAAFRSLR